MSRFGTPRRLRVRFQFKWFDLWVGVYIADEAVYVCPLPCVVLRFAR